MFWKRKKLPFNFIQPVPLSTPLEQLSFAVVDTETTGLAVHRQDRLLELGAVIVQDNQVTDHIFHQRVNPGCQIPQPIQKLTGIKPEDVHGAPDAVTAIERFFQFLNRFEGAGWAGFHLSFDLTVLKQELKRKQYAFDRPPSLELVHLVRLFNPSASLKSLEELAQNWQVPCFKRHTAVGDALTSAYLLTRLIEHCLDRGICTWGDLIQALEQKQEQFA
ncbi:hypothetical protein GCM10010965_07810 [Caldalkalibacillus thermarum]|uniref:3'-5' exonuclease n=1 Tax=Caldalkalibacillus thermarum TaxID=296745 RepID=UPI0016630337|nr:3'-5' exonuclease [Caldalkalibacillus thermarum]GGK17214.1 hypothetical protein GCM10010965_07810 [Caldalkalibacillus thermarum]